MCSLALQQVAEPLYTASSPPTATPGTKSWLYPSLEEQRLWRAQRQWPSCAGRHEGSEAVWLCCWDCPDPICFTGYVQPGQSRCCFTVSPALPRFRKLCLKIRVSDHSKLKCTASATGSWLGSAPLLIAHNFHPKVLPISFLDMHSVTFRQTAQIYQKGDKRGHLAIWVRRSLMFCQVPVPTVWRS